MSNMHLLDGPIDVSVGGEIHVVRPLAEGDVLPGPIADPRRHFRHAKQLSHNIGTPDALSLSFWSGGKAVGYVVATMRAVSIDHPMKALQLVQLASTARGNWDLRLLRAATSIYFNRLPRLLTISIEVEQTTRVTRTLRKCGFFHAYTFDPSRALFELTREHSKRNAEVVQSGNGTYPVVYFHTSSKEKWDQYQHLFRCYGMQLRPPPVTLPPKQEPQVDGAGEDTEEDLVTRPLRHLEGAIKRANAYPFVIEDTMLFIDYFNTANNRAPRLPGPDTKRWWQALGVNGLLKIMEGSRLRGARYVCQLGVAVDPTTTRVFRTEIAGRIADKGGLSPGTKNSFPYANGTFFHEIFVPRGTDQPFGRMSAAEFARYDYRRWCVAKAASVILQIAKESVHQPVAANVRRRRPSDDDPGLPVNEQHSAALRPATTGS